MYEDDLPDILRRDWEDIIAHCWRLEKKEQEIRRRSAKVAKDLKFKTDIPFFKKKVGKKNG